MKYQVVKITNDLSEYPECFSDNKQFPHLVEELTNNGCSYCQKYVIDENGKHYEAETFFDEVDVSTFVALTRTSSVINEVENTKLLRETFEGLPFAIDLANKVYWKDLQSWPAHWYGDFNFWSSVATYFRRKYGVAMKSGEGDNNPTKITEVTQAKPSYPSDDAPRLGQICGTYEDTRERTDRIRLKKTAVIRRPPPETADDSMW